MEPLSERFTEYNENQLLFNWLIHRKKGENK